MSVNSNRGLEHAVIPCKVCALVALQQAEVVMCVCVPRTVGWSLKWPKLHLKSQYSISELGFTVITWKPKSSPVSDKVQPLHAWRKQCKLCGTSRACDYILTVRTFFIRNLFLQVKQLSSFSARRFCKVWGCKSTKNIQNNGRTSTGQHTMTMPKHTLVCHCSSFWLLKTWLVFPYPPYWPDLALCDFFLFSRMIAAKRISFPGYPWYSGAVTDYSTCGFKVSSSGDISSDKCWTHCMNWGRGHSD